MTEQKSVLLSATLILKANEIEVVVRVLRYRMAGCGRMMKVEELLLWIVNVNAYEMLVEYKVEIQ